MRDLLILGVLFMVALISVSLTSSFDIKPFALGFTGGLLFIALLDYFESRLLQ